MGSVDDCIQYWGDHKQSLTDDHPVVIVLSHVQGDY